MNMSWLDPINSAKYLSMAIEQTNKKNIDEKTTDHQTKKYKLVFIQAFIQSETKKWIFIILDEEFEMFCPQVKEHFGRPLRLKKYLCGADFSGKSCYKMLGKFL